MRPGWADLKSAVHTCSLLLFLGPDRFITLTLSDIPAAGETAAHFVTLYNVKQTRKKPIEFNAVTLLYV